jgi:peptidoglycan/LPS O-acetylase OafA/YrhL
MRQILALDHLRALAVSSVFGYHYRHFEHQSWIDDFGAFGYTGVDLFFVLSGFLIDKASRRTRR